jgi:hypothetical protein
MFFVIILGGTGFNPDFKRIAKAFELVRGFDKRRFPSVIITSGLGVNDDGVYERDFLAGLAIKKGMKCLIGKGGNWNHRNTRDDIFQAINAIPRNYNPQVFIPVEGWMHALRVWVYAKMQMPVGMRSSVKCVNDGHKLTLERRIREVESLLKMFLWVLKKIFK